jgi:hypothetical protein
VVKEICNIIHQGSPAMPHAHLHFLNVVEQQAGDDGVGCRLAWHRCADSLLHNDFLQAHWIEQVVNHGEVFCSEIFKVKTNVVGIRIINGYANHGIENFVVRGQWKVCAFTNPSQIQGVCPAFVALFRIQGIDLYQAL